MLKHKPKGIMYASLGATFFGLSSIFASLLFERSSMSAEWLVTVRMSLSGIILLIWLVLRKKDIFSIWKKKSFIFTIIAFGVFGVLFAQSSFLLSVFYGNAAVATILQSLGPSVIIIILAIASKSLPRRIDMLAIILSLIGIFFLVTNGNIGELSFSAVALIWGVLSAFGVAAYTLIPCSLIKQQEPLMIVAWGLLIGGLISNLFGPIYKIPAHLNGTDLLLLAAIVILGTLFAYSFYITSLKYTEPHIVGMLSILEPVAAILISTLFLDISFQFYQMVGIILVFLSLVLINIQSSKTN